MFKTVFLVKEGIAQIEAWFSPDRKEWWYDGTEWDFKKQLKLISEFIQEYSERIIQQNNHHWFKIVETQKNFDDRLQEAKKYLLGDN